ncbi:hypothetical protein FQN57_004773 [Myotisia sp. PD_48]|nr:hypothetical protein FQN57_004773 [Myotisia sp. PD_48]
MSQDSGTLGGIYMEGPSDPDAQATVTDFIDYTEYLPSDLVRSLTLIRSLDETYLQATASVHELTKAYGELPNAPLENRTQPHVLRKQISEQLRRALNARESAYAESGRLYDLVDHYFDRLGGIKSKLNTLLYNISPEKQQALTEGKRPGTADGTRTPRITLRLDSSKNKVPLRNQEDDAVQKKGRNRKSSRGVAALEPVGLGGIKDSSRVGTETLESLQAGDASKEKQQKNRRISRPVGGTKDANKVSLEPPPPDAKPGSEHLPWLRLTDWEMARLRKKMKKNNIWQPSEIMIHRELVQNGRGWEGYQAAKANAHLPGSEFIDCEDVTNNYIPGQLTRIGEATTGKQSLMGDGGKKIFNRGMKLNEAKKQKRENLAREQAAALAAAEAEMAAKRLEDIGSSLKSLFSNPAMMQSVPENNINQNSVPRGIQGNNITSSANGIPAAPRLRIKSNPKKRKFDETSAPILENAQVVPGPSETPSGSPTSPTKPISKRLRLTKPVPESKSPTTTVKLSLIPPRAFSSKKTSPLVSPVEPKAGVVNNQARPRAATSKGPSTSVTPQTRTSSRRRSSIESAGREHLHRKSTTPAVKGTGVDQYTAPSAVPATSANVTAAGRRSKRPAPGPVTAGENGGAAVSVGRRKAKPSIKRKRDMALQEGTQAYSEDIRIDEDGVVEEIDPNEPRYCLCGDVSFGTMICCEDNDCDKEWFHIECINLPDVPSRLAKWYCPECRKKLDKIPADGIVRTSGRR